jgi:hypothetical protein
MKNLNEIKWALKNSHPKFKEWVQANRKNNKKWFKEYAFYHFPSLSYGNESTEIEKGYELITIEEFLEWRKHEDTVAQYSGTVQVKEKSKPQHKDKFISHDGTNSHFSEPMEKQITLIPFDPKVWEADKTRKVYTNDREELNLICKLPDGQYAGYWWLNKRCLATQFEEHHLFFAQEDEPEMWVIIENGSLASVNIFGTKEAAEYALKTYVDSGKAYVQKIQFVKQ